MFVTHTHKSRKAGYGKPPSAAMQGFNCEELLYYDYGGLDAATEKRLNCRGVDMDELVR